MPTAECPVGYGGQGTPSAHEADWPVEAELSSDLLCHHGVTTVGYGGQGQGLGTTVGYGGQGQGLGAWLAAKVKDKA